MKIRLRRDQRLQAVGCRWFGSAKVRRWKGYFHFNKRGASDLGRRGDCAQKVGRHIGAVVPDHGIDIGIQPGSAKKPRILKGGKDRTLQMVLQVDPTLRPILEPEF